MLIDIYANNSKHSMLYITITGLINGKIQIDKTILTCVNIFLVWMDVRTDNSYRKPSLLTNKAVR